MEMIQNTKSSPADSERVAKSIHKITSNNRKNMFVSGVTDVISFNENEIFLETDYGMVTIKGQDLHVGKLSVDQGELLVDGRIDSYTYSDDKLVNKGKSIVNRLFG